MIRATPPGKCTELQEATETHDSSSEALLHEAF
jgi:hypothetical protein